MTFPFMRDQLTIHVDRSQPGHLLIEVTGEVDLASKPDLDAGLTAALDPHTALIVLDLSGVSFLSSSGLQVLTEFQDRADELGTEIRVVCAGRPVRRPLEVVGLDRRLRLYTSVETALHSVPVS
ncbi:STAS domain-containing protein [Amycolatopsis magusensis]|uniref:Anti-sigma factor antagonist n=1 Tax=Amycolatopsis magusensis TaxID=882444 RepID=A0ABS4Q066_9PSEU|nr:STAS domain-containing protein [Amycolatopsis magusensis]MBP2185058.1 anti-anti-sigma factor [Amycolatopsis magusensis]